jgi:hypothetical protein
LSINIGKKVNVGVYEAVIYSREDSLGNNNFDLAYLNPIIFYRAIEQQGGSPDNVLLGLDFKWHIAPKFMTYGQFFLDEFLLENLREANGWWGNKFGIQFGGKWVDVLDISNLDIQLEANILRPYTYTHNTGFGSYTHYRQPLAHPLGANFREFAALFRYQPLPRLTLSAKCFYAQTGLDTADLNVGTNILLSNTTRNNGTSNRDFNNTIAQGVGTDILYADLTATYHWKHNFFIDLKYLHRNQQSDYGPFDFNTNYISAAIRWNIMQRLHEF